MRKYFYTNGKDKFGPFEPHELTTNGVTPRTLVWCEGMANWQPAETLDELKYLFEGQANCRAQVPPPIFAAGDSCDARSAKQNGRPPVSWLVESILVTLFCCMPFGVIGIINAAKVESAFYAGRIEEAERASKEARKWVLWGVWTGVIGAVLYLLFLVMMRMLTAFSH